MPDFITWKVVKTEHLPYVTFIPLTTDPVLVPGRVWFRFDLKRLRWTPDGSTVLQVEDPPGEENTLSFNAPPPDPEETTDTLSVFFSGLTTDPPLKPGMLWFRSDLGQLRWSPDGSAIVTLSS